MRSPTLKTARLVLEPLGVRHAGLLFETTQDPRLYLFIPSDPPTNLKKLRERFRLLAQGRSPDGKEVWLNWAMRRAPRGAYVGMLQATLRQGAPALIAYSVFPRFWGRGYAKEGCRAVLRELFETHDVGCVAAEMDTRNAASIRLAESLGFKRAGVKRRADFFKGASSDEYRYGLSRRDWAGPGAASEAPAGGGLRDTPRRRSRRRPSAS